jgi:hypothetical protein
MIESVVEKVTAELSAAGAPIDQVTGTWRDELRAEVDTITRPVCGRWGIDPGAMALPVTAVGATKGVTVTLEGVDLTDGLTGAAVAINALVAGVVATTLLGGGTALLVATGPVAPIVLGLALFFGLMMGTDAMMDEIRSRELPALARKAVTDGKVRKDAAKSESMMRVSLEQELTRNFATTVVGPLTADLIGQLDAAADEAELLVR